MNPDKKLLIKKNMETIINNIRNLLKNALKKSQNLEISKNILLDYYNLLTSIISNQSSTIYLLHIISREINNSSSVREKELLLTLLPEFYVPFINTDISLTDPYLSRILTSIQSNILSEVSPFYMGEIFKIIILNIFNEEAVLNRESINKQLFEICQGFCLYNMRQTQYNHQLCGIICLNFLLNEIDYSFLNLKNFVLYIWERIDFFLTFKNFEPKEYLLKYLYDFISKFKEQFKPFVNLAIYKILGFLDNKNSNIRKNSLNILSLLISFYPNEIKPIKSSIIKLLNILKTDKDENIRNKSIYIYDKIQKQYPESSKSSNNQIKVQKPPLYFYDLDRGGGKILDSKRENKARIQNKRLVVRKPIYIPNLNFKKNAILTETKLSRQNSNATLENQNFFKKNKNENLEKENKRYYNNNTNTSINKSNCTSDNEIGFRDLLKIVKKKSDNKCKLNNNFSNLREEIKKNNNGLLQLRKIKSQKVIKTI